MLIYSVYTLLDVFEDSAQENGIGMNKSTLQTAFILSFEMGGLWNWQMHNIMYLYKSKTHS